MQRLSNALHARLLYIAPSLRRGKGVSQTWLSTEPHRESSDEVAQLDFKALAENADADTLTEINRLRQTVDDLHSQFSVPGDVEKLDWSQWEGKLFSTGIVESLRKAFESLKPPDLEAERKELLSQIDSSFEPLLKEAQELSKNAEKRLKSLEQMLQELDEIQKNLPKLTADELMAKRPDLAEEVESDLKQSRWFKV
ncbi:hypothetical protein F1559_001571 [Cyanidiococcus yangmingshanensis]|uniref:ATP synthase subunit d, mitochondrial n=1 Tax=Cyanidiococcus yangmingshanensis TaxID=2690220 RepID=A0A7J7IH27_9RHOD|nr:hypothetical protein F1559_001571 [Cyanidiococcus yangmingshanensis]